MTQEEKRLLLKDLCARLPYRVKCSITKKGVVRKNGINMPVNKACDVTVKGTLNTDIVNDFINDNVVLKPYLRPISSMMQGEWEEMTALIYPHGRVNRNPDNKNELLLWLSVDGNEMPIILMNNVFSWLNAHHFDYRSLIEKGLALEAPEGLYKTK